MKTLNYIGQNGVIMRIEDGGGGQEIRFSDIEKYQGNTEPRPFIGFCTCDNVNITQFTQKMNRGACLARVISAALICRRHSAYRASPAVSRQIKEAALRLFKTKGIRKTTVAELAESVGIAKGTFYNFYATKGQLVAEIMENFDAASERELRNKIGGRDKIPIAEFYKYYVELFRPDTAFSFHFTPDDITAMQEMEETRRFFSQEHAVKAAKLVLEYVDGVREDVVDDLVDAVERLQDLRRELVAAERRKRLQQRVDGLERRGLRLYRKLREACKPCDREPRRILSGSVREEPQDIYGIVREKLR